MDNAAQKPARKGLGPVLSLMLTLLVVCAALMGAISLMRESIVISLGIRAFNALRSLLTGATAVMALGTAAAAAKRGYDLIQQRHLLAGAAAGNPALEDERQKSAQKQRHEDSVQAVVQTLQVALSDTALSPQARQALQEIGAQMTSVDDAQHKLHRLLEENDATLLSDAEDMLVRVEASVSGNARSVINYANVLDLDKPADETYFLSQAADYVAKNKALLDEVQSFLLLTTRYLNEHDQRLDPQAIESYKQAIQSMLDREQE